MHYLRCNRLITVDSLNKEPQTAEVLAKGRENMEWAMEENLEVSTVAAQPATELKTAITITIIINITIYIYIVLS